MGARSGGGRGAAARRGRTRGARPQVAYKKLKLGIDDEGLPYTMIREVAILKELAHPNIVEQDAAARGARAAHRLQRTRALSHAQAQGR